MKHEEDDEVCLDTRSIFHFSLLAIFEVTNAVKQHLGRNKL